MKKLILSITAIIMVLVSAFSLVGCSVGSGATNVSYEEFAKKYYQVAENASYNFVYDNNKIVDVVGDFTNNVVENVKTESFTTLSFKETEDGEYKSEKIRYMGQESSEEKNISVKKIDGVIFVYITSNYVSSTQYTDVEDNGLLKTENTDFNSKTTWYMGKNDNGYYIAKTVVTTEKKDGKITIDENTKDYKYYENETAYNEEMQSFLRSLYYNVNDIFSINSSNSINEIKKSGNKISYTIIQDNTNIDYYYNSLSAYIYNYEVEGDKKLSYKYEQIFMDESSSANTVTVNTYNNGAKVSKLDSFDGYNQAELSIDIF